VCRRERPSRQSSIHFAGPQSAAAASYNYRHVNGEMDALGRLYIRFVIPFLCFFLDSDWDVGPGDNPN
jgi:hypothetical protein